MLTGARVNDQAAIDGSFFLIALTWQFSEEGLLILVAELFKLTNQDPDAV